MDRNLAETRAGGAPMTAPMTSIAVDEHADRLHTYCLALLRDHDAARTATYRTFVQANAHIARLREPARLLPWLYALARNECLRGPGFTLGAGRRRTGLEIEETFESLERRLRRAELRSLRWCAVDSLDPQHREVLELSVRHRLCPADMALVLGQSVIRTRSLLDTAWHELERGLIAEALARGGEARCAELTVTLDSWDGRTLASVRERILRHVDRCQACARLGAERTRTATVPSVLPLVPAPRALGDRLATEQESGRVSRRREAMVRAAGPFDDAGFPVRRPPQRPRRPLSERRAWALVAVSMAAVAAAGLTFGQLHDRTGSTGAAQNQNGGIIGLRLLDGGPGDSPNSPSRTVGPQPGAWPGHSAAAWTTASDARSTSVSVAQPSPGAVTGPAGRPAGRRSARAAGTAAAPMPVGGRPAADGARPRRLAITAQVVSSDTVRLTLTARGPAPVSWHVRLDAPYLRISRRDGVLAAGASVRLTLTIDRENTPDGDWAASATFEPDGARLVLSGHSPPAHRGRRNRTPHPHPATRTGESDKSRPAD